MKAFHLEPKSYYIDRWMYVVLLQIKMIMRELVPLSALIVPTIGTPIADPIVPEVLQAHLQELLLEHPVTTAEHFEISLLIHANY